MNGHRYRSDGGPLSQKASKPSTFQMVIILPQAGEDSSLELVHTRDHQAALGQIAQGAGHSGGSKQAPWQHGKSSCRREQTTRQASGSAPTGRVGMSRKSPEMAERNEALDARGHLWTYERTNGKHILPCSTRLDLLQRGSREQGPRCQAFRFLTDVVE
jgi:hypothetical protein